MTDLSTHPKVKAAGAAINEHLNEIAQLFRTEVKLTLLVRNPFSENGSRDIVVTNDDFDAAIAALTIRKERGNG